MSTVNLGSYDKAIAEQQAKVKLAEDLSKLMGTPEWKTFMDEYFFTELASQRVLAKGQARLADETNQKLLDQDILCIGRLADMLKDTLAEGANAPNQIEQLRQAKLEQSLEG